MNPTLNASSALLVNSRTDTWPSLFLSNCLKISESLEYFSKSAFVIWNTVFIEGQRWINLVVWSNNLCLYLSRTVCYTANFTQFIFIRFNSLFETNLFPTNKWNETTLFTWLLISRTKSFAYMVPLKDRIQSDFKTLNPTIFIAVKLFKNFIKRLFSGPFIKILLHCHKCHFLTFTTLLIRN